MNELIINEIIKEENRVEFKYELIGEWKKYFLTDENLYVEYSTRIMDVPKSILVIPLLSNILPIAWIFDVTINLDEIDKDFFESIYEFKRGYMNMYPKLNFNGKIITKKIVNNKLKSEDKKVLSLFSGGVDAFDTLIRHIDESPYLATVWGADIKLNDFEGWNLVLNHTKSTAKLYDLNYLWVKSNFRNFIKENKLSEYVKERVNDGWWHGFQHGLGLLGLMAPFTAKYNIGQIYIASSFTIKEKGKVTCASDPTIDNYIRFNNCKVIHDGYECNRQEKINNICEYVKKTGINISLRVCWQSRGGSNCCRCEKCYRTILGILAEKQDPRNYGFDYTDEEFKEMVKDLRRNIIVRLSNWDYIQKRFQENYTLEEVNKELKWFYKKDISYLNNSLEKKIFIFGRKLKQKIKQNFSKR